MNITKISLFLVILIPIFGINFILHFIGNILLLVILIPLLMIAFTFVGFNLFSSNFKQCNQCGALNLNSNNKCSNCGSLLNESNTGVDSIKKDARQEIIEIEAEEIK